MRSRDRDRTKKNFQHNCLFKRFIIERQKETAETDDYEIIREVSYRASPVVSGDNGRQAVGRRAGAGNVASGSGAHRTAGGIGRETVPDSGSWCREIEETEWRCLLEDLPEEEGRVFVMRYLMGYNSRQIGELLSLPPGTVRYKLSSARKRLRIMIGGNGYGEEKPDTEL